LGELAAITVSIDRLGARGDGVATHDGEILHIAGALPGERVRVHREGRDRASLDGADAILTPSPARVTPFCPVFARCGGCVAQHMAEPLYDSWKLELLTRALKRVGIDTPVDALVPAAGAGRRRLTFHARRREDPRGTSIQTGFMAARSHDLVPISTCPAAEPGLAGAGEIAGILAEALLGSGESEADIHVTLSGEGLDIDLRPGRRRPVKPALTGKLIALAEKHDIARLALAGETVVMRRPPLQRMGPAQVLPQPGAFLQASYAGEEALGALILEALTQKKQKLKRVADLFAGCGPFALRVAQTHAVHAVEADAAALGALDRAARETPGLKPLTHECRDLFRRPLLSTELARFDAVILDPPRAGCEAQAKQLVRARVPLIIYVSCDPQSLVRDLATLHSGGYQVERITPVDQFAWTAHLETVAILRRP
jgi:23S rRNA (uracil1939-C5)-methyltransferase